MHVVWYTKIGIKFAIKCVFKKQNVEKSHTAIKCYNPSVSLVHVPRYFAVHELVSMVTVRWPACFLAMDG